MDGAATSALVAAGVLAAGDWVARARRSSLLEYLCKPGALAGLLAVAILLTPAAGLGARRDFFVAALAFSLLGDVLLMLPSDRFVAGLAAFLAAHLCYLAGFLTRGPAGVGFAVAAVVVAALVVPLSRRIVAALAKKPALRGPVVVYMVVISAMAAAALASGRPLAAAGAVLFAASDAMIAWDRFVRPFAGAPVAIMVTYHLGQAGLALSLVR